ncbi:MAG: putative transposase DNA-binding domain protein [Candidatus Izimaplasma bacterium HR2]|nr:MAG: putative transposase DNA-binding domain protein [Candidatus Izimaplasma bacterium HR2]
MFIRLTSIGNKISLKLPANRHRHFNRFNSNNWNLKKSVRLRKIDGKYFIDCYFSKEKSELRIEGKLKAIDVGYKKLIVSSDKEFIGDCKIYEKIARKKQGSKAFKRALIERDEIINTSCKQLNLYDVKCLIVEDLKNVKHNTKGKTSKKFANKVQRWLYPKVLNKLSMICDESGIEMIKINPAFTSQTCSSCGFVDKNSRKGGDFKCTKCNYSEDADYNASLNILYIGEYGLYA